MIRWHHRLNGHESERAPGGGEGQGSLAGNSAWGGREPGTTERLNRSLLSYVLPVRSRRRVSFLLMPVPLRKDSVGRDLAWPLSLGQDDCEKVTSITEDH